MIIRKATPSDSPWIATYMMLAMEDIIYKFIGKKDYAQAREFVLYFVAQENNQYAYQNCLVAETDVKVVAVINYYDGENFIALRKPILDYVRANFNPNCNPEAETQAGEYYIDALGVAPEMQRKGVGAKLIQTLIDQYVTQNRKTLGLLVDEENPKAKKLYLKLGFKSVGRQTLVGQKMKHLQISPI